MDQNGNLFGTTFAGDTSGLGITGSFCSGRRRGPIISELSVRNSLLIAGY
jgi:hypothetical protein